MNKCKNYAHTNIHTKHKKYTDINKLHIIYTHTHTHTHKYVQSHIICITNRHTYKQVAHTHK